VTLLDISNNFGSVNHFKRYSSLLHVGIPVKVIVVLYDWYSKLSYAVKWNGAISQRLQYRQWCETRQLFAPGHL